MNVRFLDLTAILTTAVFLSDCEKKIDLPMNQAITIEDLIKPQVSEEADLGVIETIELDNPNIPTFILKQRLIEKKKLTKDEFYKLKTLIENPEDIEFIYQSRGIEYPDQNSEDFKKAFKIEYGAPLDTLNRKNPAVCDEFAMLNASFLYGMKNVEDVFILSFCNKNLDKESSCHAVSIYKTKEGWNFTSNTEVNQINLPTFNECLAEAIKNSGYNPKLVEDIDILKIEDYGDWVYDSNLSNKYVLFNTNLFMNPLFLQK